MITIRDAHIKDAKFAVPLICEAMGNSLLEKFTNGHPEYAPELFELFFQQKNNQYSFQNCQIAQYNHMDAGIILSYDGQYLDQLRSPFFQYLTSRFHFDPMEIEEETQSGELYIDCLAVSKYFRGKGLATELINAVNQKAKTLHIDKTGLLVDVDNVKALLLYERIGFCQQSARILAGKNYWHLQYTIN